MADNKRQPLIRKATQEDVPEILAMIKELAAFENAADQVEATEELLIRTLTFAPSAKIPDPTPGYAQTLLLTFPGQVEEVGGMALYFNNFSTWIGMPGIFLEDLFVRPKYRRQGNATLLLKRLAQEAATVSNGKGRLEWNCLRWNEGALKFYEGDIVKGEKMEEWIGVRVEGERLRRLAGSFT